MSSSTSGFDVFMSFRGRDTRRTFVSHLFKALTEKNIPVFQWSELLTEKNISFEAIGSYIQTSKTAVVVISENYASSPLCLDELTRIIEIQRMGSFTIVPVYYGVQPNDVKRQTGKFGEQFLMLHKRYDPGKIEEWRLALAELASIHGEQSENWEDEAELVKEVTGVIWNTLSASNFCGPVGMNLHMKTMYKLLDLHDQHGEVREIGIFGRGGIGKTTLARYVYRQISRYFDVHVLLEDVNKIHQELQSKNIQASLSMYMISRDDIAGFKGQRVLLLADGVDTIEQIDILRKDIKLFGPNSRVIFTCQDDKLLHACGIEHLYQVEPMSFSKALQFFSFCAFRQIRPPRAFENLSFRAVKLADGLPSVVEAMGSELFGRSKEEWEMVLSRYEGSSDEGTLTMEKRSFGIRRGFYDSSSSPNDHSFDLGEHSSDEGSLGTGEDSSDEKWFSSSEYSSIESTLGTGENTSNEEWFSAYDNEFDECNLGSDANSFGVSDVSKVSGRSMKEWKTVSSKYEKSFDAGTDKSRFGVSDYGDMSQTRKNTKFNCVGIDFHIEAVCGGLMELESDKEIRIVGIWGVGGVGKTTLARCVYEETMPHFHTQVFLENVGKIYQDHGSSHLQEDVLLENIQRSSKNGSDVTKARLRNRKVLLIFDGVDSNEQIEDAQKVATWFGEGSRVIVTMRDENLLVHNGVKHVYEVKCLKVHEALQLFYHVAFKQETPSTRFKQLSVRAAQLSGRIPLALEVLASFLRGKTENDWERVLQKLERQQRKDKVKVIQTPIDVGISIDEEEDNHNDEESDDDDDDDDNEFFTSSRKNI